MKITLVVSNIASKTVVIIPRPNFVLMRSKINNIFSVVYYCFLVSTVIFTNKIYTLSGGNKRAVHEHSKN